MNWRDGLEGKSLEIAESKERNIRVNAGPGTGKTFCLMRRIARLLSEGIKPERILVISFTRMAANDIKKKIVKLHILNSRYICSGTLHSVCLQLMNDNGIFESLKRSPRFLFDFEKRFLLEDLSICDEKYKETYFKRADRLKNFEAAWATEQNQIPGWPTNESDKDFLKRLEFWLNFHKSMIISELIPLLLIFLHENPQNEIFELFDYILVDEFQDLNKAEQELVYLLSRDSSLIVAGDEDQSIYETMKYAHPQGIMDVDSHKEELKDIDLLLSRRCSPNLLVLANNLITKNKQRRNKAVIPNEEINECKIKIIQWKTLDEEINGICNYLLYRFNEKNFNPKDCLVISPRSYLGFLVNRRLKDLGLPSKCYFGEPIFNRNSKKIDECSNQIGLTLLNLLNNPEDRVSLRCWLGFGSNNYLKNEYSHLVNYCLHTRNSPYSFLNKVIKDQISANNINNIVKRYKDLISKIDYLHTLNLLDLLNHLFPEESNWKIMITGKINNEEIRTAKQLLTACRDSIIAQEIPTDVDHIRIMSIHKAKGLTVENVVLIGCNDGLIPSYGSGYNQKHEIEQNRIIEEQRRLFYVAITREEKELIISSSYLIPRDIALKNSYAISEYDGPNGKGVNSRFLKDLMPHSYDVEKGEEFIEPYLATD